MARSRAMKLSTVRTVPKWLGPQTCCISCSREKTVPGCECKNRSRSNSRAVDSTSLPSTRMRRPATSSSTTPKRAAALAADLGAPPPPQRRADARDHLDDGERLGHVIVGAERQRQHLVALLILGRQHDDRRVGIVARAAA